MIFSRIHIASAALFVLTGCGNSTGDFDLVKQIWTGLSAPEQATSEQLNIDTLRATLTPDVLAQIDGPLLLVQIPSRGEVAGLTRVGSNDGIDTFLTSNGVSISLRDGAVVATRGLGFDLMTADVTQPLAAISGGQQQAVRIHRYLDGENQLIARSFICTYSVTAARRVVETCKSPGTSFENEYVVDSNRVITSSRQWISPEIGSILTEFFE